jgi:PAS domain-containing protein
MRLRSLLFVVALGVSGCDRPQQQPAPAPTPEAAPPRHRAAPRDPGANLGADPGASAGERAESENAIPLALRGDWVADATGDCRAASPRAAAMLRITDDTVTDRDGAALIVSIDQISADYLRATFAVRRGGQIARTRRTLYLPEDGQRLTIRIPAVAGDAGGNGSGHGAGNGAGNSNAATITTRYRRCSVSNGN